MLLFMSMLLSCRQEIEYSNASTEQSLKELLAGTSGKVWVLGIPIQDCNSNIIASTVAISIYPTGVFTDGSTTNQCSWSVRIEKTPVRYQEYLIMAGKAYKIFPYSNNTNFYILDESTNQYIAVINAGAANPPITGTVKDFDGYVYQTKVINNKNWMLENLRVSQLNSGTGMASVGPTNWSGMGANFIPALTWQNNDSAEAVTSGVGGYYNYYAVSSGRLCPTGWHVATAQDWNSLIYFAGGDSEAGSGIKSVGGTNTTGFNGIIGGIIDETGNQVNSYGAWWVDQTPGSSGAATIKITTSSSIERVNVSESAGLSVRCVQD